MTISVFQAAKTLGHCARWQLSNLQMQKILYIAHMFYMGEHDGEPLVDEYFQAWDYGPVLPKLYHEAKFLGIKPVDDIFYGTSLANSGHEFDMLKRAAGELTNLKPGRLVQYTHRPGGAWAKNYRAGLRNVPIPNEDILTEYKSFQR